MCLCILSCLFTCDFYLPYVQVALNFIFVFKLRNFYFSFPLHYFTWWILGSDEWFFLIVHQVCFLNKFIIFMTRRPKWQKVKNENGLWNCESEKLAMCGSRYRLGLHCWGLLIKYVVRNRKEDIWEEVVSLGRIY